ATGCKCLCNALLANVGQAQLQKSGFTETPLLTSGDDINMVTRFLSGGSTSYKAKQVLDFLRAPTKFDEAAAGDGEAQPLGSPARKPFEAGSSNDATNNAC
ncbi:MAG: hypothetical protein QF745_04480, partial [Planctomycetota bacterium]|nr:hypothetical protein [Planctomycetota bacterium]